MKEKAWKNVIAVLIIALALMAGGINVSAASGITIRQGKVFQNNKVYTGWFSQNNGKYYSVKGIRAKGWKKISNKYYYFDRNSRLITNHIVGSKTTGYFYVDKTGVRAYIARVLGYDARVACGAVTARGPYAALSPHGWCEVKYGNAWKMLDCSMQRAHTNKNLCLVTRKQYPFRLRCDRVYTMKSSYGTIKWA